MTRFLIIDARFYEDIADQLLEGAVHALEAEGCSYDHLFVPGVLEVPAALAMVLAAIDAGDKEPYDGYVALGCVIRGETSHYDSVAGESARALMDMAVAHGLALGNGILTVENMVQAVARASRNEKDKGGAAARAALAMMGLKRGLRA